MKQKLWAIAFAIWFGSAAFAVEPNLSPAEQMAGWRFLFNGEHAASFRSYKKPALNPGWKVVNGELSRVENGAGDIVTREKFENFELSLE